jgi:3-(3-hydroxy-phenyl)propionate hydroxylase
LPAGCLSHDLAEDWRRRGGQMAAIGPEGELQEEGSLFANWMESLQAEAVIVRPDRHVYGVARSIDEIDPIVRSLVSGLDCR